MPCPYCESEAVQCIGHRLRRPEFQLKTRGKQQRVLSVRALQRVCGFTLCAWCMPAEKQQDRQRLIDARQ